jgi:hypothetical protein
MEERNLFKDLDKILEKLDNIQSDIDALKSIHYMTSGFWQVSPNKPTHTPQPWQPTPGPFCDSTDITGYGSSSTGGDIIG